MANIDTILDFLIQNENIIFKNQSRDEDDLSKEEKMQIGRDVYIKSKPAFLIRFGKYLTREHLDFFKCCTVDEDETEEIKMILVNLSRFHSEEAYKLKTKNRRYQALKKLISENTYFSESEMMKRNPLLYEQLIGRYLTAEERKQRDKKENYDSLVKILLEGIERDMAEDKLKKQREEEDEVEIEDEDTSNKDNDMDEDDEQLNFNDPPVDKIFKWGEFPKEPSSSSNWGEVSSVPNKIPLKWGEMASTSGSSQICIPKRKPAKKKKHGSDVFITAEERQLMREEFTSIMYQNFLNGEDEIDYSTIDNNDEYDNMEILEHDAEDKYFDSEEPEDINMETEANRNIVDSSEDELDIYMNALNQHPAVLKLSKDLKNL